jgi:RNA polymerase sigma factor (sigma-70 family)
MASPADDLPPDGPLPPGDAELIAAVRGGDTAAFGELYTRHSSAALGLARQMTSSASAADDLVAEAFANVLEALQAGGGPDTAFRAYLLTTVRHGLYDSTRRDRRLQFSDDLSALDPGQPFVDPAMAELESTMIARAYASLPERWQTVLWHTEIEGQKPADVAPLLGLTPNGAAALAYRAREGLRQAYLQAHLAESAEDNCRYTVERLGAYARGGLSKREATRVEQHLAEHDRCRALAAELSDINGSLRAVIAPLVLGAPFVAGYLASHFGTATVAGTAGAASSSAGGAGSAGGGSAGGGIGGGAGTGGAGGGAGISGGGISGAAIGIAAAAAAVLVIGGVAAWGLTRGDGSSTQGNPAPTRTSLSSAASTPTPTLTTTPTLTATPAPTPTPTPTSLPTDQPTPTVSVPSSTAPASPVATRTPPAAGSPTAAAPTPPPATSPLSVAVGLSFNGYDAGSSGTLSGQVGSDPQVRLLSAVPAGWTVTLSGPCAEAAPTTVCTLSGSQGAASVLVTVNAAGSDHPSLHLGLFADAGDPTAIASI